MNHSPSDNDHLIVIIELPNRTAGFVFRCWTNVDLLTRWWPALAETEPRVGGQYVFNWPKLGQMLRGTYIVFEPARQLVFSWQWDHDIGTHHPFEVQVDLASTGDDTTLTLTHRTYSDTEEDQDIRLAHHWAGWQYFLPRLAELQEK